MAESISYTSLETALGGALEASESKLREKIDAAGDNPTTADLLIFQQLTARWTLIAQLNSTVVKELTEALKGIVQKIN